MKIVSLALSLLIPMQLFAFSCDTSLLQIGAKLFPKVLFMEKETKERIKHTIHIVIVASPTNSDNAKRFMNMVENYYPDGINNHPIRLSIIPIKEGQNIKFAHAIVLMASNEDPNIDSVISNANENQILTFSLDPALLQNGTAVSLFIGKSVKPYLNLTTLKNVPYSFEYGFIKLSVPYND